MTRAIAIVTHTETGRGAVARCTVDAAGAWTWRAGALSVRCREGTYCADSAVRQLAAAMGREYVVVLSAERSPSGTWAIEGDDWAREPEMTRPLRPVGGAA